MYYSWPSSIDAAKQQGVWWSKPLHYWARQYVVEQGTVTDVTPWLNNNKEFRKTSEQIGYTVAGSLVNYLIDSYGLAKFQEFYRGMTTTRSLDDITALFERIYGVTFASCQKSWQQMLMNWK